jgi:hypothetical protein
MVRRRHADVIAAVWIIFIALDFLRRNDDPCSVFAPPSQQTCPNIFDFGRVAVLLVAAALARVIRHVPGAVELFVKLHVLRAMVVFLSLGRERQAKKRQAKTRNEAHGTKEGHDEPRSRTGFRHSPTSPDVGLADTDNCIHRARRRLPRIAALAQFLPFYTQRSFRPNRRAAASRSLARTLVQRTGLTTTVRRASPGSGTRFPWRSP